MLEGKTSTAIGHPYQNPCLFKGQYSNLQFRSALPAWLSSLHEVQVGDRLRTSSGSAYTWKNASKFQNDRYMKSYENSKIDYLQSTRDVLAIKHALGRKLAKNNLPLSHEHYPEKLSTWPSHFCAEIPSSSKVVIPSEKVPSALTEDLCIISEMNPYRSTYTKNHRHFSTTEIMEGPSGQLPITLWQELKPKLRGKGCQPWKSRLTMRQQPIQLDDYISNEGFTKYHPTICFSAKSTTYKDEFVPKNHVEYQANVLVGVCCEENQTAFASQRLLVNVPNTH